jgi:hypothetical protein
MYTSIYGYEDGPNGSNRWGNSISRIFQITTTTDYLQVIDNITGGNGIGLLNWTLYVSKLG